MGEDVNRTEENGKGWTWIKEDERDDMGCKWLEIAGKDWK